MTNEGESRIILLEGEEWNDKGFISACSLAKVQEVITNYEEDYHVKFVSCKKDKLFGKSLEGKSLIQQKYF